MTVHLPIERSLNDAHVGAIDEVNRWRGHCVECYARLEYEVVGTLSAMAAKPCSNISVPHNFGEKVKKLRAAVGPDGLFKRPKLANALDSFTNHLNRRNMLVHATGKVWTDGKGEWLWLYRFQPSGKGRPVEEGHFEQGEALAIEKSLARESQSLGGQLRALREKLKAVTE